VETIGSKRSYALTWCMPNNDDDDDVEIALHCDSFSSKLTLKRCDNGNITFLLFSMYESLHVAVKILCEDCGTCPWIFQVFLVFLNK